jgi:uncharacterized protein YnzC (UPF0291/DUF896 family)
MEHEKILRINELARLSRERPLTPAELAERETLRREYVADFRAGVERTLGRVSVREPDGTLRALRRKTDAR